MRKNRKSLNQRAGKPSRETKTTILMVDDATYLLSTVRDELEDMGYFVITAASLKEGLVIAREYNFDLLITDKNLGYNRGVVPLLDYMSEEKPFVPVLLFSGEDGKQARKELYCHGFAEKAACDEGRAHFHSEIRRLLDNPPYPTVQ